MSFPTVVRILKRYNIPVRNKHDYTSKRLKRMSQLISGENNPMWVNGRKILKGGYIGIHMPEHPNANSQGYYEEHRYIMEQHIGRLLTKEEMVHHKNHIPDDNRIENLELLDCNSSHAKIHYKTRIRNTKGQFTSATPLSN
jgi:hypothetical protein